MSTPENTPEQDPTKPTVMGPTNGYIRPLADVLRDADAEIKMRNKHPDAAGILTGIASLDERIKLAMVEGQVILVAGESGRGKSAFVNQLAVSAANQVPTLIMTLEDEAQDAVKRLIANMGRINVGALRAGFAGNPLPGAYTEAVERIRTAQLDLNYVEKVNPTVLDVGALIHQFVRARGGQHTLIIIDQLSLLAPVERTDDMMARCARVGMQAPPRPSDPDHKVLEWQMRALRRVAEITRSTIVVVCQLNNQHGENEKPTVRSIRGSQGIVHEAALTLVPWVPRKIQSPFVEKGQDPWIENTAGAGFLLGLKGRRVPEFEVPVKFLGEYQAFVEPNKAADGFTLPPARSEKALEGINKLSKLASDMDKAHRTMLVEAAEGRAIVPMSPRYRQAAIDFHKAKAELTQEARATDDAAVAE